MSQTIYTLVVDAFAPDIVAITVPLMEQYAEKIGAELVTITERLHPELPACMEKFQVRELAAERGDSWSLFLDADTLVHPDLPDLSTLTPPHSVVFNASDYAPVRFRPNGWSRRDGRHIAPGSWLVGGSRSVWSDLWFPITEPIGVACDQILPAAVERAAKIDAAHLLDDYVLSRNVARFGLRVHTVRALCAADPRLQSSEFFWHQYTATREQKAEQMLATLERWGMR